MKITFSFGRNWLNYVEKGVDEQSVAEACANFTDNNIDLRGKIFIDIGCGSGLFSLAAILLGAKQVISIDVDPYSIKAASTLKTQFLHRIPKGFPWSIFKGDIHDPNFVNKLRGMGDVVYSWGVLNHTCGDMNEAILNTATLVSPGGILFIAVGNHAPTSANWEKTKAFYNRYPLLQPLWQLLFGGYVMVRHVMRTKSLDFHPTRGMHVFYDAVDWLGGYPYNYACHDDVKELVEGAGFRHLHSPTELPCGKCCEKRWSLRTNGIAQNELVFVRV